MKVIKTFKASLEILQLAKEKGWSEEEFVNAIIFLYSTIIGYLRDNSEKKYKKKYSLMG